MGVRRRKSAIVSGVADLGREETIKRALPQLFDCPRPLIPKLCHVRAASCLSARCGVPPDIVGRNYRRLQLLGISLVGAEAISRIMGAPFEDWPWGS